MSGNNNNNNIFQYVCRVDQVPIGQSKAFSITGERGKIEIALFNLGGTFYAISNVCIHKGGPLSKGTLEGDIVICPWHGWKYSVKNGKSPHKGGDSISSYPVRVSEGRVYVNPVPENVGKKISKPHKHYQELDTAVRQHIANTTSSQVLPVDARVRVLGISATNMNDDVTPRTSTSEAALEFALDYAKSRHNADTVMLKLRQLNFRHCEGYYSKNAKACIFPCSISEMDEKDKMIEIYDRVIVWADVVIIATPIRWGNASSLYYQMVQRMNCVQNQIITHGNYLIRDKVGAFIITGGQDNVQHVAGELLSFWSQLGFVFGKFPFVGWSRGWYAEDTENNVPSSTYSSEFKQDIMRTVTGAIELSGLVKKSRYDERVLESKFKTMQDNITP
jgi:nitrite reductase/ring-hydroxylating ferredoxin subunit/multimeric flavodoxin WrbA